MIKKPICLTIVFLLAFVFPSCTSATTTVQKIISTDTVWNYSDGPYLITDTVVLPGVTLTINDGVEVVFNEPDQTSLEIKGSLRIMGRSSSPVSMRGHPDASVILSGGRAQVSGADIGGIAGIFVNRATLAINDSKFFSGSHISAEYATVTASSLSFNYTEGRVTAFDLNRSVMDMHDVDVYGASTFARITQTNAKISSTSVKQGDYAIVSNASKVRIDGVYISTRKTAIKIGLGIAPVFLPEFGRFVGGLGDAFEPEYEFSINNSSFGGTGLVIDNTTSTIVDARMNWWGVGFDSGGTNNRVSGPVIYTPALSSDPFAPDCCSNVVFLPGIKGTRLYSGDNRLWEPNRNLDVERLMPDSNAGIEVGDIIGMAYGMVPIYQNFIDQMNSLVGSGTIKYWQPLPYDWRKSPSSIAVDLIDKIISVASTSPTNKISVIAHSYGGLVVKSIIQELEKRGRVDLVDKVLLVSTPEYGVPHAFASLMHGLGETMLGGFLLNQKTARNFGQSLISAHELLPSDMYFRSAVNSVKGNAKAMGTSGVIAKFYSKSVPVPDSKENLDVSSINGQVASTSDLINLFVKIGSKFKSYFGEPNLQLLKEAIAFHDNIDNYLLPHSVQLIRIAPWGIATTISTLYRNDPIHCGRALTKSCTDGLRIYRMASNLGDSTVAIDSIHHASSTVYLDIASENKANNVSNSHANILSSVGVQSFVEKFIKNDLNMDLNEELVNNSSQYASLNLPKAAPVYTVEVFSPVSLTVCDSANRCTGIAQRSTRSTSGTVNSIHQSKNPSKLIDSLEPSISIPNEVDLEYAMTDIPGSSYIQDDEYGSKGVNLLVEQGGTLGDYTIILDGQKLKKGELPIATLRISTRLLLNSVERDVVFANFDVKENMRFKLRLNRSLIKNRALTMEVFNDRGLVRAESKPDKIIKPTYVDNSSI